MKENENKIKQLVRVYVSDGSPEQNRNAAIRAARFIESPTLYDIAEKYNCDVSRFGI